MGSMTQAKTLGLIGSLLVLLSSLPFIISAFLSIFRYSGIIIGFLGYFLILIAVKNISEVLADTSIFNNMLIFFILTEIGAVAWSALPTFALETTGFNMAISLIFYIVSVIFLKKSYDAIASKLSLKMFSVVALLKYFVAVLFGIVFFLLIFASLYSYFTKSILTEASLMGGTVYLLLFLAGFIYYLAPLLEPIAYFSIPIPDEDSQEITIIDTTYQKNT
jgi:uncharacterized membrane protein